MRHPDYPFWNIICLLALLLPAPWHWKARNVPIICLIAWLWLYHFTSFINSLVWADNYADWAPVWCDISARFSLVLPYAVPLCSLAQMRRLAAVASPKRQLALAQARQRSRRVEEYFLCVACPLLILPVTYTVQGHRYDLLESMGPSIPTYLTWPTVVIRYVLPAIFACASLFYAAFAMRRFFVRRAQFRSILSGSGLTTGVYLRLLGLAISDCVLVTFAALFNLLALLVYHGAVVQPIISWKSIHSNFSLISQFPEEAQDSFFATSIIAIPNYVGVLYALFVFAFFSFGEDAVSQYLRVWRFIKRVLHLSRNEDVAIPTLGSTIVTLTGPTWAEELQGQGGDKDGRASRLQPGSSGIAVMVERSIV